MLNHKQVSEKSRTLLDDMSFCYGTMMQSCLVSWTSSNLLPLWHSFISWKCCVTTRHCSTLLHLCVNICVLPPLQLTRWWQVNRASMDTSACIVCVSVSLCTHYGTSCEFSCWCKQAGYRLSMSTKEKQTLRKYCRSSARHTG